MASASARVRMACRWRRPPACCVPRAARLTTTRQRFHDETATGTLGNPTTGPKARVSYVASYYDAGNRLTDTVDVGTNGGSAYTRPGSVSSRSDTALVVSYGYDSAGRVNS